MIRGLGTVTVVEVAAGSRHSLALTDSGRLFAFGDNSHGQLGLGNSAGMRTLTPQVGGGERRVTTRPSSTQPISLSLI